MFSKKRGMERAFYMIVPYSIFSRHPAHPSKLSHLHNAHSLFHFSPRTLLNQSSWYLVHKRALECTRQIEDVRNAVGLHRFAASQHGERRVLRAVQCVHFCGANSRSHKHGCVRLVQIRWTQARVNDRFDRALQADSSQRIHVLSEFWVRTEERRVEFVNVFQFSSPVRSALFACKHVFKHGIFRHKNELQIG